MYLLEKHGIIYTMWRKYDEEYDQNKFNQLKKLLQSDDTKSIFLMITVYPSKEAIEINNMIPSS
jgi:hypothetical protein